MAVAATMAGCAAERTARLAAELANMNIEERTAIDKLMTTQLDINGYINYAENKGREEGREEGLVLGREKALRATARNMVYEMGLSAEQASQATGLKPESFLDPGK